MAFIKHTKLIFHGHVETMYSTEICIKYCLYACSINLCVDIFSDHWEHIMHPISFSLFSNLRLVCKELTWASYTVPP